MAGRKSFKEEIKIIDRLTALSEPTFKYIQAQYEAGEKADKKWAVEQMIKLYAKCIPQPGDDEDNPVFQYQITGMKVLSNADKAAGLGVSDGQPKAEGSV